MTTKLTERDLPILRSAGFRVGASGYSWFKAGDEGIRWQAVLEDDGVLEFYADDTYMSTLTREEFSKLFELRNPPRTDTGD